MADVLALRARPTPLWRLLPRLVFALVFTAVLVFLVVSSIRVPASNDDSSASFSGVLMAITFAAVPWMWWQIAKMLRLVPLVTIEVDGLAVRFLRPALRTLGATGAFETGSAIALTHALVRMRRIPDIHVYTARQGQESVRFMGWATIGDDSLRAARDQLLGSGVDLNIDSALESGDTTASAPTRLRSTLESRGGLYVEPAPGVPVEAEFAVSGGELTYAALGSDRRGGGVRWLKDDEVAGEVRGFSIGAVTTVHVTVTFDDVAPGFKRKDRRDLPGLTDHLVFVDEIHDDPCHVLPVVPVKGYEVLVDPADASRFVLRLVAGPAASAAS